MTMLHEMACEACRADSPRVSDQALKTYLADIPRWQTVTEAGVMKLRRIFEFKNFRDALEFSNAVGELAENYKHHPSILTEWGKVTVTWWTHKIKGLHKTDFIMAAKTDRL
jgi:4a-hydroxytetrahydrobiopterin dehydratase